MERLEKTLLTVFGGFVGLSLLTIFLYAKVTPFRNLLNTVVGGKPSVEEDVSIEHGKNVDNTSNNETTINSSYSNVPSIDKGNDLMIFMNDNKNIGKLITVKCLFVRFINNNSYELSLQNDINDLTEVAFVGKNLDLNVKVIPGEIIIYCGEYIGNSEFETRGIEVIESEYSNATPIVMRTGAELINSSGSSEQKTFQINATFAGITSVSKDGRDLDRQSYIFYTDDDQCILGTSNPTISGYDLGDYVCFTGVLPRNPIYYDQGPCYSTVNVSVIAKSNISLSEESADSTDPYELFMKDAIQYMKEGLNEAEDYGIYSDCNIYREGNRITLDYWITDETVLSQIINDYNNSGNSLWDIYTAWGDTTALKYYSNMSSYGISGGEFVVEMLSTDKNNVLRSYYNGELLLDTVKGYVDSRTSR